MKIPVVGPAYKHPSLDVNNQRCVNMFFMSSGVGGIEPGALVPTGGLELLIDLSGSESRGLWTFNNTVFSAVDNKIYKIDINELTEVATTTLLGTIDSSTGTIYAAANPTQVIWVDGSAKGYIYTFSSGVFQEITAIDVDFTGGGQVVFIDSYFIVNAPGTGNFYFSAANNGLNWDPSDVATAESGTDNIVGLKVSKGELWIFGDTTTEIWYNAANVSGSPFSPRDGLELQIGCGAAASIVELDDLLIWLDNRGFVVQSNISPFVRDNNSGYKLEIISTEALTNEILNYSRRDDAIAIGYNYRGHLMYQITFPSVKKTWVYDYTSKVWHERSYFDSFIGEHQHHLAQYYTQYKHLHLMSGVRSGKVYVQKTNIYTDAGDPIYRIRTTQPQYDSEDLKLIGVDKLELRLETGNATQTGEGSDPQITMRYSSDGGRTWSHHLTRSLGRTGEYAKKIQWNRLGVAFNWVFEFTIVEPINFSIIECFAKITDIED